MRLSYEKNYKHPLKICRTKFLKELKTRRGVWLKVIDPHGSDRWLDTGVHLLVPLGAAHGRTERLHRQPL